MQAGSCAHCEGNEQCGAIDACGVYDLRHSILQVAAEFCAPKSGLQRGTVTLHGVELIGPHCQ